MRVCVRACVGVCVRGCVGVCRETVVKKNKENSICTRY